MNVKTIRLNGTEQWWSFDIMDYEFPYYRNISPNWTNGESLFKFINGFDLWKIRITPIVGNIVDYRYSEVRGSDTDSEPFMIRGKRIGKIFMVQGHNGIYARMYNSSDSWNFTDKQREILVNEFSEQLTNHLTEETLRILKEEVFQRVVKSLKSQIAGEKELIEMVENAIANPVKNWEK